MTLTVDLDELAYVQEFLRKINSTPIHEIEWRRDGVVQATTVEELDEFRFCGLNNVDFATRVKGWVKP